MEIAAAARASLLQLGHHMALTQTLEQAAVWARIQTQAGCAFAAVVESPDTLRWVAASGPSHARYQPHCVCVFKPWHDPAMPLPPHRDGMPPSSLSRGPL
jgi:hypothetical protein